MCAGSVETSDRRRWRGWRRRRRNGDRENCNRLHETLIVVRSICVLYLLNPNLRANPEHTKSAFQPNAARKVIARWIYCFWLLRAAARIVEKVERALGEMNRNEIQRKLSEDFLLPAHDRRLCQIRMLRIFINSFVCCFAVQAQLKQIKCDGTTTKRRAEYQIQ